MVYYRKYRPQLISELDLASVRDRLTKILSSQSLPHAFLFTGSRGLGKTSSARILAKAINCVSSKSFEPCNACVICKSITSGSHMDVIEIDGASNRGVDEIRELRSKVKFAPSELQKKVYIIDEVHMLTNEAFNALLKTLEEPPEHVVFVLATTEAHKIPQTILSRAFSVKFESPTREEIALSLKRIAEGEKLTVDDAVIDVVSELSEGSFRDAAKILEELALTAEDSKITADVVETVYKTSSIHGYVTKLVTALQKKDAANGLKIVDQMASEGVDVKRLIEEMVRMLHTELRENSGRFELREMRSLLQLLNEAYGHTKFSVIPQLPLELVIIEYCSDSIPVSPNKEALGKKSAVSSDDKKKPSQESVVVRSDGLLKDLIALIHEDDKRVAAFLRSCKDAMVDGSALILTTPYSLHADKLRKPEFSELILKHAQSLDKKITGLTISTV